jgi:hypothetical protein
VYAVVGAYGLLLGALLLLPAWVLWMDGAEFLILAVLTVLVLVGCGLTLTLVPVRVVRRRPVQRRNLWWPIAGGGLLAGALLAAAVLAVIELCTTADSAVGAFWYCALGGALVWIGWGVIFLLMVRARSPEHVGMKLHRWLFLGSVAELLVAVPCHIVVRRRTECCAGIATGTAIFVGAAVMIVALGPGVFLLYHRRARDRRP